jgi:hypothetical protein
MVDNRKRHFQQLIERKNVYNERLREEETQNLVNNQRKRENEHII